MLKNDTENLTQTYCPDCGLVFNRGRWTREAITRNLMERRSIPSKSCPACFKIKNRIPGAMLTVLRVDKMDMKELEEIVSEVTEYIEKREPLERMIIIKKSLHEWDIHTTGKILVEKIAKDLKRNFGGDVQTGQSDEKLLRLIYVPAWDNH